MEKYNINGINIISLCGSWREMGRQYGDLADIHLHHVYDYVVKKAEVNEDGMLRVMDIAEKLFAKYPHYLYEFFEGMAETSTLTPWQLRVCNAVEYAEPCFFCSALVTWNNYAEDNLVFGRNYDAMSYAELAQDILFTVYHPDDALSFVTVGYAGEIYCVNGFNESGIFIELNNGMPSAGDTIHWDVCPSTSSLFHMLTQVRTLEDVERFFATTQSFASFIITVADANEGRAYEWCYDGVKRADEMLPDGLVVSTNHYIHRDWEYPTPTDDASWCSITRHANIMANANAHKGELNVELMQRIMDTPIGAGGSFNEYTRYQLVVVPSQKRIWIKTGIAPWTVIDLAQFL